MDFNVPNFREKVIDNKLAETYNYICIFAFGYISEMLMETGEIPVQCRCCVGGVFFIMPLEQLFREGGESEDAQVRIQALNVSDSLRATAQQIIYHSAEYRFCVQIRT